MVLAALALGLRLILQGGVMLSAPAAGALPQMVICTGQGAMAVTVGTDGQVVKAPLDHSKPDKPSRSERPDHPCAFAASVSALSGPELGLTLLPMPASANLALLGSNDQRPGLGLAAPPPPTTGPPILL